MKKFLLIFVIFLFIGCTPPEGYSKAYLIYKWGDLEDYANIIMLISLCIYPAMNVLFCERKNNDIRRKIISKSYFFKKYKN